MEPRETGDRVAVQKAMTSLAPLDVTAAKGVLREAKEIMDELGVVFFLRQGTCLGAVRDNVILPWDDDIDIGSIIGLHGLTNDSVNGVVDRVVARFTERGFSTRVEQTSSFTYVLLLKFDVRIDWECFNINDGTILHWPPKRFPIALFTELKEIDFLGQKHYVPDPPEEYLATKYGPDWRTPKPSGSYEKDVLAMIPDPPRASVFQLVLKWIRSRLSPPQTTPLLILDHQGAPVADAHVHVAGIGASNTDSKGHVSFALSDDLYHSFTIRFGDHEEILYLEQLTPGQSYVYRPDPDQTSGRSFVLSAQ